MMPTIPDGSSLIVDFSQKGLLNGCITVINVNNNLLVKRIDRRINGDIALLSDNPLYPPQILGKTDAENINIIGRVVYFGRPA